MDIRAPFATPILRVLFDLARDRVPVDVNEVAVRVIMQLQAARPSRAESEDLAPLVRIALRVLERSGLVQFLDDDRVRLSMSGFALAVALPPLPAERAAAAA